MVRGTSFADIVDRLAEDSCTAGDIVDAIDDLKRKLYARDIAEFLSSKFGENEKLTRIMIRASGRSKSRVLHDILAKRLMDRRGGDFLYELIDALAQCNDSDYAAVIIPFLKSSYGPEIQSTAVYALGVLRSPLAVLPLIRLYRKSDRKLKRLVIEALRKIFRDSEVSVENYLFSSPKKIRDEIRQTVGSNGPSN